jgi:hypothetical protein
MDPCVLMRSVGRWQNATDDIISTLCDELTSSVEHVEYAFNHRRPTPTLASSPIDWEQSIVEGHATHPVSMECLYHLHEPTH